MGKTAGRARFARIGIAVAVLVVLAGIGVALAATVGGLSPAGGSNALVVEEPMGRPQDTLEAEPEAPADAAAQEAPVEKAAPPAPTPSTTGALKVTGAQLTDAAGEPVQLRGVSTHGLAWYPQYVNQEFFTELRDVWGANVVRLATYSAEEGGYATETGDRTALNDLVVRGVQYAQAADLYAVVDWHTLSDANPATNQWAAEEFFRSVSGALGDADNVIYEICNEPNGGTSWADIKAYAEAVIPIIRANDPDAIIVVGTPTWSQDLAAAAADPLPDANVMYALHFYAATHEDDLRRALSTAVAGGLPVFVTEFGICEASGAGEIDYASANLWVRLMNELDVSYICWNLSNKDETAALFKPGCAKTSGFTLDDLTDEGLWLVDTLKSPGFSREEVALARAEVKDNSAGAQMLVSADDTLQWTFQVADRWEEGGRTFFRYEMAGSNYSAGVKSWSVVVPFNGEVTLEDAWNCKASASGTRLTVANDAHNGNVPAGGFVRDVGFIVSGPADLAVVECE